MPEPDVTITILEPSVVEITPGDPPDLAIVVQEPSVLEVSQTLMGPPGPPGDPGAGDKYYQHVQSVADTTWNIAHGLGKFPSVTIVDSGGSHVLGEVVYLDQSNCQALFSAPFSGTAECN